jgi:hypothetical protein
VNDSQGQQPAPDAVVHELARPVTKLLAWGSVVLGAGALALATRRNLQHSQ